MDATSLFEWVQNDLQYNYMHSIVFLKDDDDEVNKVLTPEEKQQMAAYIIPLDQVYENRQRKNKSQVNYHYNIHGNLTIYQKIHDPFFRLIKYQEFGKLLYADTLGLLTKERMEAVKISRNDTQPEYAALMHRFFAEPGTAQAMFNCAQIPSSQTSAPFLYMAVAARVVLLSWIGAYDAIIDLLLHPIGGQ
jgi:hypothetical protein